VVVDESLKVVIGDNLMAVEVVDDDSQKVEMEVDRKLAEVKY